VCFNTRIIMHNMMDVVRHISNPFDLMLFSI
jgi:hypothetical protein